jgi:hypothetical protein
MKKILLFIFGILAFVAVSAQRKQNVYFLKNGLRIADKDSADLIRVIQEPDSGSTLYSFIELYPDGTKKTQGSVSEFEPKLYHQGPLLSFNKNGTRKSVEEYVDDKVVGRSFYYFENGRLEKSIEYVPLPHFQVKMKLMDLADSSGHVMVKDGNGHALVRLSSSSLWQEEGDYVDGEKHGKWATRNPAGDSSYKETFNHGKFILGESLLHGISYTYKKIEEGPTCEKGLTVFYNRVTASVFKSLRVHFDHVYGHVFLSFSIEPNGSVSNQKVDKGLDPRLDKIALQAIDTGLKWIPGRQHGIPVSMEFHFPIGFSGPETAGVPDYTFPDAMSRH